MKRKTIKTAAGQLTIGKRYGRLVLKHGTNERELHAAKIVAFQAVQVHCADCGSTNIATGPAGEERYEAEAREGTVGFLPEHVVAAT